jgi:hypothetical protein
MAMITKTGFSRDREYIKMIGMGGTNMQLLIIYQFNTGLFVFTASPPALLATLHAVSSELALHRLKSTAFLQNVT